MIDSKVGGHNCNKDTEGEYDNDGYDEYDHFGDFIEFKKELKTNGSFLQEVSKKCCDIWSLISKILNFDIELILESLTSFKSKNFLKD